MTFSVAAGTASLDDFDEEAAEALRRCRHAAFRIRAGIELLGSGPVASRAFRFANRAMWQQRVRSLVAERRREDAAKSSNAQTFCNTPYS